MFRLLTLLSVVLCLIPVGAHFFELPNKMLLPPEQYMIVQKIYAGWALFGIPTFTALILTGWHTYAVRRFQPPFFWSLVAFLCLAAGQAVFWAFTYPMNVASQNWTVTPANFAAARQQWEYSHALNAVLTFVAFVAISLSVLADNRAARSEDAPAER